MSPQEFMREVAEASVVHGHLHFEVVKSYDENGVRTVTELRLLGCSPDLDTDLTRRATINPSPTN
jgi:hypothetical protein